MTVSRAFIDTNVIAYTFDNSEPKKQERAIQLLGKGVQEFVVSTQVMQELYVSLTRGRDPITTADLANKAVQDLADYIVVQVDVRLILAAIALSQRDKLSFWDALIVSTAAQANCEVLLTEDLSHGQLIQGVRVENPFA